jgi:cytochrome c peroxidase
MRISKMSILRTLTIGLFAAATVACSEDAINGIDGADGADGLDGKDLTEKVLTPLESSITPVALVKVNSNYSRSLAVFDSKFDNNINEKEVSLMVSEKKGFNLFMGKAACATCHFPPAFNGTVPPYYKETEFEVIGVPKTKKWKNAELDSDLGRYHIFPMKERKGYFKTPSLRNIEKTAPYMHNGVYNNLEEVMKFYNKGGGIGIGIDIENQTLPFSSLDLSDKEIEDIIAFMKTLTDTETLY